MITVALVLEEVVVNVGAGAGSDHGERLSAYSSFCEYICLLPDMTVVNRLLCHSEDDIKSIK